MWDPEQFLLQPTSGELLDEVSRTVATSYASPGCWVALVALAKSMGVSAQELLDRMVLGTQSYAKAMGLEAALNADDTYAHIRKNRGKNYSPLVVLHATEDIDAATRDISSCVREWFRGNEAIARFVADLCDVVGDLHDNVWSHAESAGVSMASKWCCPGSARRDQYLEFALADAGRGFRRELERSGVSRRTPITDDADAIRWCIVRGNSSKIKEEDPWAQSLPMDMVGNPMGDIGRIKLKENNHLGIGLAKLIALVEQYKGELWLASGDCLLRIADDGTRTYHQARLGWQGVLLACRFRTSLVVDAAVNNIQGPDDLDRLIDSLLQGESHEQ